MKSTARINILFVYSAALLLLHLLPVPISLDTNSVIVLGIMYVFCFLEQAQIRSLDAQVSRDGVNVKIAADAA